MSAAERPVELYAVDGALLMASDDMELPVGWGIVTAAGAAFDKKLEMAPVEATMPRIHALVGTYPGALDLVDSESGGPVKVLNHRVLDGGRWNVKESRLARTAVGVAKVGDGVVALTVHPFPSSGEPPEFWTLRGSPPALKVTPSDCAPNLNRAARIDHEAFGVTDDGTAVAFGRLCGGKPAAEWWPPGETSPRAAALPATAQDGSGPFAKVVGDWIVAEALWHFDGTAWKLVAPPLDQKRIVAAARDAGAALWVVAGQRLFVRRDDSWQPIGLPKGVVPGSIAFDGEGRLWLASFHELWRLDVVAK